ncbi:MAG: GH92 family glycosyl hydrolase [Candidatus Pseudobacter hemicellulosilyticus]|uniref:GH92 family glycosyl hydrolase n=1 Tax=Candidatus Pseudobacter hemicellulosilyticus TaxID=3121375 RepID=A0AAJ5WST5_9BACT|nr:MAG: GH92 family glycosyl hydrolase [Pseudobacter sp.]
MKKLVLAALLISGQLLAQQPASPLQYVDPTIGGVGVILEPARPTVQLPNSMLRVYPMKRDQIDDQISHFPLNVPSHRLNWVFGFLPVNGPLQESSWSRKLTIGKETLTPYYYQVSSEDATQQVEFTLSERSGFFRVYFKDQQDHYLRFGILNGNGELQVSGKRVISGMENFFGMKAYFYAETDTDLGAVETKQVGNNKVLLIHAGNKADVISMRYGVSYISVEQAKYNLQQEIKDWNFSALKNKAYAAWDKALSLIHINGGTIAQKRVFYTSLYRCYERMVNINEYGKYYSGYDHQVHTSNEPFYVDNWLWDTYIALEPLHMILHPKQEAAKIRSYLTMYDQTGWMPSFSTVFGDWPAMTGNNAAIWMTDAWFKGIRDFDVQKAYQGMKKGALESTILPWNNGPLTSLDSFYQEHGYMPGLLPGEPETEPRVDTSWEKRQAVSVTIDNSYSDWCIAQLAPEVDKAADRNLFLKRAKNYEKVFRADKGIVWPKDKDGNWIEPYDPSLSGREYFTEINAYNFNWAAKHDLEGLFKLMGGVKGAESTLDQLFREDLGLPRYKFWRIQPDASGLTGQFVMGNEPTFHIPYLYNYMGAPWKTQKRIRMLLDTWFPDNLFGLPGDEDGGGMCAFVVFSMMGFFPVTPGIPVYTIGSPVFNDMRMQLPNGKQFRVTATNNSAENKFIQKASFNGRPLEKTWFTHEELMAGGVLTLVMGAEPNTRWGSRPEDAPPSSINYSNKKY